ncbi:hypothetical protein NHQ30_001112 [Ciborinia camelliae]|nr:hypothetical protein NHQ30_001112 [Ciborinia camelliae]
MIILGASILVQAGLATWALVTTRIPTWSSNPLDTTFACLEKSGTNPLVRRQKRCMNSVHDTLTASEPCIPKRKQGSVLTAHSGVKWILGLVWLIIPLGFLWFGITSTFSHHETSFAAYDTDVIKPHDSNANKRAVWVFLVHWTFSSLDDRISVVLGTILVIALLQATLTIGLHCAELLCNLSQRFFRLAISSRGSDPCYNSTTAALKSWQTMSIFMLKEMSSSDSFGTAG